MLLDSASLYFRSYYALPDSMTAPDGTPVNAVRGFVDTIARIITERGAARLVACLDADWRPGVPGERAAVLQGAPRRRRTATDGSEEVPDTLTPQIPIILDVLDAVRHRTGEADGLRGRRRDRRARRTTRRPTRVEVVTGDRDLFQVVRVDAHARAASSTSAAAGRKAEVLGPEELAAKYALPVENAGSAYADMSVLRGDPSDGLPGVAGIGEKTAAKLITEFGSLDAVLKAVTDPMDRKLTTKARNALIAAEDYLAVAPVVVRTALDAPVVLDRSDERAARARRPRAAA